MIRFVSAVVLAIGLVTSTEAITVVPITFEELVRDSTAVVYARVAEVRGRWTADRRTIESVVLLDALRYLKGDLGAQVALRLPGGEAGGLVQVLPGAPVLREGDLAVLFLGSRGPSTPTLVGFTQGVFRVIVDSRSGSAYVAPPALKASAAGHVLRGAAERRRLTIDVFASEVQSIVEGQR